MNKSQIFKAAHALTKATVQAGDSYAVTFAAALRMISKTTPDRDIATLEVEGIIASSYCENRYISIRIMDVTESDLPKAMIKAAMTVSVAPARSFMRGHVDLKFVVSCDADNAFNANAVRNLKAANKYVQELAAVYAA